MSVTKRRWLIAAGLSSILGQLLVRIYPDGILADSHDKRLTERERDAGQAYWRVAWKEENEGVDQPEAWTALVREYKATRAAWIVQETMPLSPYSKGKDPDFPNKSIRLSSQNVIPTAPILPDRWVVVGYQYERTSPYDTLPNPQNENGPWPVPAEILRAQSEPVKEPLQLSYSLANLTGSDGSADEPAEVTQDMFINRLKDTKSEISWAFDFGCAEEAGMALRIPLTGKHFAHPIDVLLVFGVKSTLTSTDTADALGELFEHQRLTRGLAFVPQGAPTNNTEEVPAAYPPPDEKGARSFRLARRPPILSADDDGWRFLRSLGLKPELVRHIDGADGREHQLAAAMARVLWPTTIGFYMHHLTKTDGTPWYDPSASPSTIDLAKEHFVKYVHGRGPYPAFRVGDVPYGLLPVSAIWGSSPIDPHRESSSLGLVNLYKEFGLWHTLHVAGHPSTTKWSPWVRRVDESEDDPNQVLEDILRLSANARTYFMRGSSGRV